MLAGVAEPFDAATLDRLYPDGKQQFLTLFQRALDTSIQAGFILPADRAEILDVAAATYRNAQATSTPSAAPTAAQHYTTAATPIGDLLDNDAAKTILTKYVPNLVNSPQISQARGMTLKALQAYSPNLTDATLAAIDMELATLPQH
jgi:hypothetical protein